MQRRFTKRLAGLKKLSLSYGQRLKLVNLPSLKLRRLHTDLLWCYKIVFGVVDLMCDDFVKLCPCTVTRGHVYKLYKPSSTSSARSRFFACRIWHRAIHFGKGVPKDGPNVRKKFEFRTISSLYVPYISVTAKNRGLQAAYVAF